jgi:exonuclease V
MASHSTEGCTGNSLNDDETDYGSDFSPEEAEILLDLASRKQRLDTEDNPIVTDIEDHGEQALRVPRALGRGSRSPLFQAARAADEAAERIGTSVENDADANCKPINFIL